MYPENSAQAEIIISGGSYSSDVSDFLKTGYIQDDSTNEFIVKKAE